MITTNSTSNHISYEHYKRNNMMSKIFLTGFTKRFLRQASVSLRKICKKIVKYLGVSEVYPELSIERN